ncbi:hypothetical protein DV737_g5144, partial [Chaetothyriales sp. CBS 132003]
MSGSSTLSASRQKQSKRDEAIRRKMEMDLSKKKHTQARARHTRKAPPGTVLALKPSQALQIKPSTTVAEAAQLMAAKREDCVLVTDDDDRIAGIFTAKDLAFRVVGAGVKAREVTIEQIMTKNPLCARTDTSATDALDLMVRKGFRHLPVMDENQDISGILDITKCFYDAMEKLERAYSSSRKLYDALEGVQSELGASQPQQIIQYVEALRLKMSGPTLESVLNGLPPTTVSVRTSVKEAAQLMKENHTTAVLVQDQGSITGIFTSKDVVLRVIAPGLDPANCSVVRVMTPHPDFAPTDMSIQAALRKMHDGHYLNLPVMNETGEIVGMVDVLKLTYATLEQINTMGSDGQEGPAWNKFWMSMDNADSESVMSGEGSRRPTTPGHRSILSPEPSRANVERGDSVQPHESASHRGGDEVHSDILPSVEVHEEAAFPFKFKAPGGRVHRVQVVAANGIAELVANVSGKLGPEDVEAVGGEAVVVEGRLANEGFALSYIDNEGDTVSITTDQDVLDAIVMAQHGKRDKVDLLVHDPLQPPVVAAVERQRQRSKLPTPPESVLKEHAHANAERDYEAEGEGEGREADEADEADAEAEEEEEEEVNATPTIATASGVLSLPSAIPRLSPADCLIGPARREDGIRLRVQLDGARQLFEAQAALQQLLQALQSTDNIVRSQAEDNLNNVWFAERVDWLLVGLAEQIQSAPETQTRSFAPVLLRRQASKSKKVGDQSTDVFLTLSPDVRAAIRTKLLESLSSEQINHVRNKISDAIAELARQYTDSGEVWADLLGALFGFSQSGDASMRECAFRIFAATPGIIERQHEAAVLEVFAKGFKDASVDVKLAAVEAFAAFFDSISKKAQAKYGPLIPEVLNIMPPLKEAGDTDNLSRALVSLIELAETAARTFKGLFNNLVKFCISVVQDKELGDQTRQNALELMTTFAEHAPAMCKKDADFTASMWNAQEDLDVEESDQNHVAGEQAMDRLANKLGPDPLLGLTFTWLPQMIASASWRDRHAALMAISAISEGCRDTMVKELGRVLDLVVPTLKDAHPRVRFAGCNALGQMSTDFAGPMQELYHRLVMSSIIPVLQSPEPRVQAHAAAALVNFCEEAEKAILEPYLEPLLRNLVQLLNSPKRYVQEQALSTIATIADSAQAAFATYYDSLMPMLLKVLSEEQSIEFRLLRAKAMECATLIALAVGQEKMGPDATSLVEILGRIQAGITDADDPQSQYLLHCWGRMCRVLGSDFLPYLPGVMPPLLELAAAKADIQLLDNDDEALDQEDGWELVPLKGKIIGIKTQTLEDKNTAIELITIYAQILGAAFAPYVENIAKQIAIPSLAFFFHDPVRVSSAKLIPQLLNSYKHAYGPASPQLAALWHECCEKEIELLDSEPAIDTLAEMYQCFYESVEVVGKNCLSPVHMQAFVKCVRATLDDYQTRSMQFAIEDDQTLLSDMNKAFHTIFKNMGLAFLPEWQRLMPFYDAFITSPDATQRQWAICIMDDVLEFCGPQSYQFADHIMQPLVNGLKDANAANRQAAAYGVGTAAQKGGDQWAAFVAQCIPLLFEVTQLPNARSEDDVFATENACAAIAKILRFNSAKVDNAHAVLQRWLGTLPVVNDEEAAPYAYLFIADLVKNGDAIVTSRAEHVFRSIVQALEAETLQGKTAAEVAGAGKTLVEQTGINAQAIIEELNPDGRQAVSQYFS